MRSSAARAIGRQVVIASVASARDFDAAFAQFIKAGAGALLVPGGSLTTGLRRQIVALAIRHAIPALYSLREFVDAGGLMSYGPSRSVPIVFTSVIDPVGGGFIANLARPGGNVTGFMPYEFSLSGKLLELLKEIAPSVTRAAVFRDPTSTSSVSQFAVIQSAAGSLGVELSPIDLREANEIERGVTAFARTPNGGLIVTGPGASSRRSLIITLAAQHKLPAVYPFRYHVASGGLISYGPDITVDQFRRAAGYVDRILNGEKPADLPVQAPTKYELVINLKTAKALGLEVPPSLLARADEVIE